MSKSEKRRLQNIRSARKRTAEREKLPRIDMKPPYHDRLRDYDALHVQKLWEESIELDVDLGDSDPFYAKSDSNYKELIGRATTLIATARQKLHKFTQKDDRYSINREAFRSASYSEQKVLVPIFRFESRMTNIHHEICSACNECSLNLTVNVSRRSCGFSRHGSRGRH